MLDGRVLLNRCSAIIISTLCIAIAILAISCGGGGSVNVAGTRGPSAPSLSPSSLAFASQAVGATTAAQMITLTNSGNADLSVTSIAVSGANASDFTQSNNCGSSVAAGANCVISVTFKPAASGTRSAAVAVSDNAAGGPQTVALSGSIATTLASVSPSSLALGDQPLSTASPVQAITLTNTGNADLSVTSVAVSGANASDFAQTNNCSSTVAARANCTISVTFKPAAAGPRTAAVIVADSAPSSPQTVALSGTGDDPVASISSSSVAFGNQSVGVTSTAQAVTLTNTGNAPLNITSVAVFGSSAVDFAQTNNCPIALAAGANCTISVTFTPSAAGSRSAALAITDNAAGSPQSFSLSGTGISTVANLSPSSVAFGNQSVGTTSAAQAVRLSNSGSSALSISSIAVFGSSASDFAQTNNCGLSLAAGANCTISVTFTPSAAGSRGAALAIADNATGSPQSVSLSGIGISTGANVSPSSVAFGNQSVGTTSTSQVVTLSNSGNSALTVTSIAVFGSSASDFAQTNNCGITVAAGANCTISVTFTPTATGTRTATVTLTDDAASSPQTVALSGTGSAAIAGVSPTSLTFASQAVGATSAAQTITLANSGNVTLTITSIALSGTNAGDFAQTNNCGSIVAAGSYCSINVTFKPAAAGTRTAAVTLTDNATGSPQTVPLSGTIATTVASASPSSLTFATQAVRTNSASQAIILANTGNATLNVSGIALSGANASDFAQTNNCGASVAAGANCTINATFKPTAAGARTATVTVADSATDSPQTVALSGTGAAAGASVFPTSLAFGNQSVSTTSTTQSVTLTNSGNAALSVTSIAVFGTNASDFAQTNNCGTTVAAGANCTISVKFTPSAAGSRSADLAITDNATGSPQSVSLSGTGISIGANVSPSSLLFGNQSVGATSTAQAVTLTNSGTAPLNVTSIAVFGTNASDFAQTNNCGISVAAGANCTISLTFTPSAAGSRAASLAINDNATGSPQTVSLTGTGTVAVASLSPTSLTFSSQAVGETSAAQTITLNNTGNAALSITSIAFTGANASDFTQVDTCGASVAAGGNCTIAILFTPSATGTRVASLSISDNAAGSPQSVGLFGTGISSVANASPSSLTFGNQSVGASSTAQAVALTNSGNSALSVTSIAVFGANASDFAQTNNCGSSVAAGANCTISVTFTPSASGSRASALAITDNATGSPQSVSLSGVGTSMVASASPTSLAFGNQSVGATSTTQSVTLTNSGNAVLSVTSIAVFGANAGDFAQTNNCGSSVAAEGNCTIAILFTPSATGTRVASLSISDNASGSPLAVSLSGTGTQPRPTGTTGPTYYVDNCVVPGSDSNNGTSPSAPWLTISKVSMSRFNPGDSILFESTCTWREQLTVPSSGSAGSPITFGVYGTGAAPQILGSVSASTAESWTLVTGNVWQTTASIPITPSTVWRDNVPLTLVANTASLNAVTQYAYSSSQVYVYSTSNPTTDGHSFEIPQLNYAIAVDGKPYVTIDGLAVSYFNWYALTFLNSSTHGTIQNSSLLYNYTASALNGTSDYFDEHANTIAYCLNDCVGINSSHSNIYRNDISHAGMQVDDRSGITVIEYAADNNVYENVIHDNNDSSGPVGIRGIILDSIGTFGVNNVFRNLIYHCNGHGIQVFGSSNQRVFNNISRDNTGSEMIYTSGISIADGPFVADANLIANNTLYGNQRFGIENYTTGNNIIKNNLIDCSGGVQGYYASTSTVTLDYNLWYGCTNLYWMGSNGYTTPAAFYSATGQGQHDISADPQFVNASAAQFWLASGSPAIDAGINLGSPYNIGLFPGSSWPNSVLTGDQNSYGTGWEIGAYIFTGQTIQGVLSGGPMIEGLANIK